MSLAGTLSFIVSHPLARLHRRAALGRWLRWQLGKRLLPGPLAVPYVDDLRLLIAPGMTGATGNYYCGLHEFEDMAFVLHLLRPGDGFADVGANIGSYTLLALAAGAQADAFEPVPAAFSALMDNVNLNGAAQRVRAHNRAVGAQKGSLQMTMDRDTMNRAVPAQAAPAAVVASVEMTTLDEAFAGRAAPALLKVDVEGYESQVLQGARGLLADPALQAVILELNGSGNAYGFDDEAIHQGMLAQGFQPCRYEPFSRRLGARQERSNVGNTLYVRDLEAAAQRVASARSYRIAEVML
jgi:FkbM family methyltransferase